MEYCVLKGARDATVMNSFVSACKMYERNFNHVKKSMLNRFNFNILEEVTEEEALAYKKASEYSKCYSIDDRGKISLWPLS